MSINLNSIRDILNIKDDNIIFSDNFYLKKKFRYVDSHFFFASLSYVPRACPCCGALNVSNSIVKNSFKSSRFRLLPIVQNFTRALDKTRIAVMNGFARDSQEYKVLNRCWKMFLLSEFDLNTSYFRKYTHFNNFMSQASIVSFMRDIDPVLDESYRCVQSTLATIRLSNTDMLSSLFDKKLDSRVSNYVNVAIETCRRNEKFVLNACRYKLSNDSLEGKINKIKLIKRNAFGHRNFYNYKKKNNFGL